MTDHELKRNVLIVEDDPTLREAFTIAFKTAGFFVASAEDGLGALDKAAHHEFDLIILDILMPHLDGFGFLEKFDCQHKHPDTKIIVFSNDFSLDNAKRAKDLGAYLYYAKAALTPHDLVKAVR